jgi:hypothetical protein
VIHVVGMEQTKARYWFARCSCSWTSLHVPLLAEAETAGLAHVREHNERPSREA